MTELLLLIAILIFSALTAVFAFLTFMRIQQAADPANATREALGQLMRAESDAIKRANEEQSRGVRQELSDSLKNFQDGTLNAFRILNEFISTQIRDFSGRLDNGVKSIDDKVGVLGTKLNQDLAQMESEAHKNRDSLRSTIEQKLEDATVKQPANAKELQEQLEQGAQRLGTNVTDALRQTSDYQREKLEIVSQSIVALSDKLTREQEALRISIEQKHESQRRELTSKLDDTTVRQSEDAKNSREEIKSSFEVLGNRVRDALSQTSDLQKERLEDAANALNELGTKLAQAQEIMKVGIETRVHSLQQEVITQLSESTSKQEEGAKEFRSEIGTSFQGLGSRVGDSLQQASEHQRERLESNAHALKTLSEKLEQTQENLKGSVESRLDAIRQETAIKLDEMRLMVDDKLQTTLEARLGESFTRVVDQLNQMHQGIGEMKNLAANVGDLKHMLTNPKIRGTFGEVQLSLLLEEMLTPEQYVRNAQVRPSSGERVEFAIKMPGREGHEVLLPVDAKFPVEDYHKLVAASEANEAELVILFRKQLHLRIRSCAKDIRDKYINPPTTTDFAVLFLPTESLYAEVLREPGLLEALQRDFRVTLAGPTTLGAYLNALQMGFRTLAIEKRSSEVWQVLGAVRAEFGKYNAVVQGLASQLNRAITSVDKLGTRTRVMERTLKAVETIPDEPTVQKLLGLTPDELSVEEIETEGQLEGVISSEIVVENDLTS